MQILFCCATGNIDRTVCRLVYWGIGPSASATLQPPRRCTMMDLCIGCCLNVLENSIREKEVGSPD